MVLGDKRLAQIGQCLDRRIARVRSHLRAHNLTLRSRLEIRHCTRQKRHLLKCHGRSDRTATLAIQIQGKTTIEPSRTSWVVSCKYVK